jgi:DNA-binding CsgD family transcriptional regulator
MTTDVIAREAELAVVQAFLERPSNGPRALVLEGEPGIGKSTLWSAAVAAARGRFANVLVSRPAESERSLANVVLGDLFGGLPPEILAALPGPRRQALETALLIGEADGAVVDPRALAAAVLAILAALAAEGPLALAIDDEQWVDASSAASLTFALRRLERVPIWLVMTRRVGGRLGGAMLEAALEASDEPRSVERIRVDPLSLGALQLLLKSRLGVSLSRPNLLRVNEASGGNPLFALELARALPATSAPPAPLVVPPSLERLLDKRLRHLDEDVRQTLLLVAAHGRASRELLQRLDLAPGSLDRATVAQLIESSGGTIRFTHPLLASTVYQRARPNDRRAAHLRLAAAIDEPIGHARHLALATSDPDEAVAAALESGAAVARARGMPIVTAELAEHSMRLTPPGRADDSLRRGAIAARAHAAAGEAGRARAIVEAQLAEAPRGPRRAEALVLGAQLEEPGPAVVMLDEGLREAAGSPAVQALLHERLADVGRFVRGRSWAERHALAAARLAERLADDRLRARALSVLSQLRFEIGDPDALEMAREAYRRAVAVGDPEVTRIATVAVGHQLMWARRLDEARDWLEGALVEAAERDELLRSDCLWYLALVELWAGHWDIAWGHAQQSSEIHAEYGIEQPQDHMPLAMIALHRGRFPLARDHSKRAISLAEGMMLPVHVAVLGIADLWSGQPAHAIGWFDRLEEITARRGVHEPAMSYGRAEHIEALLQLGRIDAAERVVTDWENGGALVRHAWVLGEITRSMGLVAIAHGELDRAVELLEQAIHQHEAAGDPFGRGRALLALGGARRRQRQKRLARTALEAALADFEALGATSFVDAARRELGQLGGRRRLEGLSPSERRVAELVAQGRTNREIAAALFLGERTVVSHLTHIYGKLGLRSRTELAQRWAREAAASVAGPTPSASDPASPVLADRGKVPTS